MLNEPLEDSASLSHLQSEIERVTEQQIEALRMATFLGLTELEAWEYQKRGKQIAELVNELKLLMSKGIM